MLNIYTTTTRLLQDSWIEENYEFYFDDDDDDDELLELDRCPLFWNMIFCFRCGIPIAIEMLKEKLENQPGRIL
ncbi:unnamed protein product [Rhizophagus irregularis]|nr:unnamed protein product [Rhizophagus irregularis]